MTKEEISLLEASKQAREVIQDYVDEYGPHDNDSGAQYVLKQLDQAIDAASQLPKAEQEPVAEPHKSTECVGEPVAHISDEIIFDVLGSIDYDSKHHKTPLTKNQIVELGQKMFKIGRKGAAKPPKCKPVAYLDLEKISVGGMAYATNFRSNEKQSALYTTPYVPEGRQQRKPLTDEQIEMIWTVDQTSADDCASLYYAKVIARAIEAAHGIKGKL